MGLKYLERQGCKGFSSFCRLPLRRQKNRSEAEPGAARPGAQISGIIRRLKK